MKSNLLSLVKIELTKVLSSFSSKGRKPRQTPILYFGLLIGLMMAGMSCLYSWLIIPSYIKAGIDSAAAINFFAGISCSFIFMSTISQARGIYIGEDYDMLAAMPIRKRDVVASKIITLYLVELLFSVLVLLPHGIMQIALANNLPAFFIALLVAFTLPIVPIAIAVLVSLLVTMATARFKSANIVFVVIFTLFIIGLTVMSVVLSRLKEDQATAGFSSIGNALKWINPSYILAEMSIVNEGQRLLLLVYAGVNIVVAALTVLFLAVFYDRLHEIVSSISMKKAYVRKDLKTKGQDKVLLGLEFKRMVNSKMFFINSIMGSVMAIVGSVVFLVIMSQSASSAKDPQAAEVIRASVIPIFIATVMFIIGIGNPTTGSINMEGKTFWIIKSLPVDYKKYMWAKLRFAWILTIPAALIASTIAVIFRHENVWDIIFAYVIPLIYVLLNSVIGLSVALNHPKLKWSNENEAVKNSASVVIPMFINFGLTMVLGGPLIALAIIFPNFSFVGYLIITGILIAILIPCSIALNKRFAKKIRAIEDF